MKAEGGYISADMPHCLWLGEQGEMQWYGLQSKAAQH